MTAAHPDRLVVVLAVLTYQRPDALQSLLAALLEQATAVDHAVSVLVVDNDPDASARMLAERWSSREVRYVHEPRPGIASARNRALDESADAQVLVFIDDDERPVDRWLDCLLQTFVMHPGAGGVVGPVVSSFAGEVDPWIEAGDFFNRRRMPTGSVVDVAATNNLLLDLSVVRRIGVRFDARYGLTGGSDTLFTRQMTRSGARLVWCDEAVVFDQVPPQRLTRKWVTRRALRSGNGWARVDLDLRTSRWDRLRSRSRQAGRGSTRLAGGGAQAFLGLLTGNLVWQARGTRTATRGCGMALGALGIVVSEYHRPRSSPSLPERQPRVPFLGASGIRPDASLGIVVVNYGSHRLLEEHVARLDLSTVPANIVVVDNYHSLEERSAVTCLAARHGWRLLIMENNVGFAAAVNEGAAVAAKEGATALLLLNPDVSVDAATVQALLEQTRHEPDAIVTPQIVRTDGTPWFRGSRLLLNSGDLTGAPSTGEGQRDMPWLTAACLAVPVRLWNALGGMDPQYFLYWEDVDLSFRCLRAGGRLVVRQDLCVTHAVGGTQSPASHGAERTVGEGKSNLYYYYNCRNRLLFASKHLTRRAACRWIVHTPAASWRILLRGGGRRHLIRSTGPTRAAVGGALAGLGHLLRAVVAARGVRDVDSARLTEVGK